MRNDADEAAILLDELGRLGQKSELEATIAGAIDSLGDNTLRAAYRAMLALIAAVEDAVFERDLSAEPCRAARRVRR